MTQIGYQSKGVQKLNTDLALVNKILCPQILIQKLNLSTRFSSLLAQLFMSRVSQEVEQPMRGCRCEILHE